MAFKSQIFKSSFAFLNHAHLKNQVVRRFSQSPLRPIPTNVHVTGCNFLSTPLLLRSHPRNFSSEASSSSPPTKTVKILCTGRTVGVGFDKWAMENATELGLNGRYFYRGHSIVEILVSGDVDKVDEMQERCKIGPVCAIVSEIEVEPSTEDPGTGFRIIP